MHKKDVGMGQGLFVSLYNLHTAIPIPRFSWILALPRRRRDRPGAILAWSLYVLFCLYAAIPTPSFVAFGTAIHFWSLNYLTNLTGAFAWSHRVGAAVSSAYHARDSCGFQFCRLASEHSVSSKQEICIHFVELLVCRVTTGFLR